MEKVIIMQLTIRPYTTKQLAGIYLQSERTMRREIALIKQHLGTRDGYEWSREQVTIIFEHIPPPYNFIEYEGQANHIEKLKQNATYKKVG